MAKERSNPTTLEGAVCGTLKICTLVECMGMCRDYRRSKYRFQRQTREEWSEKPHFFSLGCQKFSG